MRFFIKIAVLLVLALICLNVNAQDGTDEKLARHYFQEGDFEKAVMYYEKIYSERQSVAIYRNYLKALLELQQFKTAEKLVKSNHRWNCDK